MTDVDNKDFLQGLRKNGPTKTQRYYLKRVQRSEITPEEFLKCEVLDLSAIGKAIFCNLRGEKRSRYFRDYAGIYVQVNPTAHWNVKIGWLPEIIDPQNITQANLYYKQLKIIPCKDSDEAAALYLHSQGMPYEKAVCEYIWFCTLIQIWKAVRGLEFPVYAGIAHSNVWVELISAPKE